MFHLYLLPQAAACLFTLSCFRETFYTSPLFHPISESGEIKASSLHHSSQKPQDWSKQTLLLGEQSPFCFFYSQTPTPLTQAAIFQTTADWEGGLGKDKIKCHEAALLDFHHHLFKYSLGCCKLFIIFQISTKLILTVFAILSSVSREGAVS